MNKYSAAINNMLKNKIQDRDFSFFHPSSFGNCPRYIYFEMSGVGSDDDITPEQIRIFDNGHAVHLRHQLYCLETGILQQEVAAEVKEKTITMLNKEINVVEIIGESGRIYRYLPDETLFRADLPLMDYRVFGYTFPGVSKAQDMKPGNKFWLAEVSFYDEEYHFGGHCDAIVNIEGTEYIIDWKSVSDHSVPYCFFSEDRIDTYFSKYPDRYNSVCFICGDVMANSRELSRHLISTHYNEISPDFKHVVQLHIYMWQFNVPQSILVHEIKSSQEIIEHIIPMDERLVKSIKDRSKKLWKCIIEKNLPDIPTNYCSARYPCLKCGYRRHCYE